MKATLLLAGLCLVSAAQADVYVVVAASHEAPAMSLQEVRDIYMGRTRAYASGVFVAPLDMPRGAPVREEFYAALTGMSAAQLNSYWARLSFAGHTLPPKVVASEQAGVQALQRNPAHVFYLEHEPKDAGLRVVLILRKGL